MKSMLEILLLCEMLRRVALTKYMNVGQCRAPKLPQPMFDRLLRSLNPILHVVRLCFRFFTNNSVHFEHISRTFEKETSSKTKKNSPVQQHALAHCKLLIMQPSDAFVALEILTT